MYRSAICELAECPSHRFLATVEQPVRETNSVAPEVPKHVKTFQQVHVLADALPEQVPSLEGRG